MTSWNFLDSLAILDQIVKMTYLRTFVKHHKQQAIQTEHKENHVKCALKIYSLMKGLEKT